jgi:hypothetical protein
MSGQRLHGADDLIVGVCVSLPVDRRCRPFRFPVRYAYDIDREKESAFERLQGKGLTYGDFTAIADCCLIVA